MPNQDHGFPSASHSKRGANLDGAHPDPKRKKTSANPTIRTVSSIFEDLEQKYFLKDKKRLKDLPRSATVAFHMELLALLTIHALFHLQYASPADRRDWITHVTKRIVKVEDDIYQLINITDEDKELLVDGFQYLLENQTLSRKSGDGTPEATIRAIEEQLENWEEKQRERQNFRNKPETASNATAQERLRKRLRDQDQHLTTSLKVKLRQNQRLLNRLENDTQTDPNLTGKIKQLFQRVASLDLLITATTTTSSLHDQMLEEFGQRIKDFNDAREKRTELRQKNEKLETGSKKSKAEEESQRESWNCQRRITRLLAKYTFATLTHIQTSSETSDDNKFRVTIILKDLKNLGFRKEDVSEEPSSAGNQNQPEENIDIARQMVSKYCELLPEHAKMRLNDAKRDFQYHLFSLDGRRQFINNQYSPKFSSDDEYANKEEWIAALKGPEFQQMGEAIKKIEKTVGHDFGQLGVQFLFT